MFSALNPFKKKAASAPYLLALDVGSDFCKALIFQRPEEAGQKLKVIGAGSAPQGLSDTRWGVVSDIKAVAKNIETAIGEASLSCQVRPAEAVLGASGAMVKGLTTRVRLTRAHPDRSITERELSEIDRKVRDAAFIESAKDMAESRGQSNLEIEIVSSETTALEVDGFAVKEPLDFKGERLELSFFTAFCLKSHLHALARAASLAKINPRLITSGLYALLKGLLVGREPSDFDAVLIDVGGETTDIGVVFGGGLVSTETLTLGGRDFTRAIGRRRDLNFADAENLKLRYAAGSGGEETALVSEALAEVSDTWLLGVREALLGMAEVKRFPPRIFLTGGGSLLPEIERGLNSPALASKVPFAEPPKLQRLLPQDLGFFEDQTGRLDSTLWVVPLCLGYTGMFL